MGLAPTRALQSLKVKVQTFVFIPSVQIGHSPLSSLAGTCPGEHWSPQVGLLRLPRQEGKLTFSPELHQPFHPQELPVFCFYSNQMNLSYAQDKL